MDVLNLRLLSAGVASQNRYIGQVVSWHDGDTGHVSLFDPAINLPITLMVRLVGINAPELSEPGGKEVTAALANWLPPGRSVTISGLKPDKYAGRIVAALETLDGTDVSTWLLSKGYAVPFSGDGPKPHVPWPAVPPAS